MHVSSRVSQKPSALRVNNVEHARGRAEPSSKMSLLLSDALAARVYSCHPRYATSTATSTRCRPRVVSKRASDTRRASRARQIARTGSHNRLCEGLSAQSDKKSRLGNIGTQNTLLTQTLNHSYTPFIYEQQARMPSPLRNSSTSSVEALRVPRVGDLAGSLRAAGRAGPALSATLAVESRALCNHINVSDQSM